MIYKLISISTSSLHITNSIVVSILGGPFFLLVSLFPSLKGILQQILFLLWDTGILIQNHRRSFFTTSKLFHDKYNGLRQHAQVAWNFIT